MRFHGFDEGAGIEETTAYPVVNMDSASHSPRTAKQPHTNLLISPHTHTHTLTLTLLGSDIGEDAGARGVVVLSVAYEEVEGGREALEHLDVRHGQIHERVVASGQVGCLTRRLRTPPRSYRVREGQAMVRLLLRRAADNAKRSERCERRWRRPRS